MPRLSEGQVLTFSELRDLASTAASEHTGTQASLAALLGVSPGALSKALNMDGPRFWKLQSRVVSELTDFSIEEVTTLVVRRKG